MNLTPDEAGVRLRVTGRTIRNMIVRGEIRAIGIGTGKRRTWRIPLAVVEELERCNDPGIRRSRVQ